MATYNLVNSVKGGCGKTTFSIWLAYYLNVQSEKDYEWACDEEKEAEELLNKAEAENDAKKIKKAKADKKKASAYVKKCEEELNAALLIDMDLLGTSMQIVFKGNDEECKTAVTNDVFQGVKNNTKTFIEKVRLKNDKYINVIFASMDKNERRKFKSGKYAGYTPVVKHSIFRSGLRELIKNNGQIESTKVRHFIFDMPPNSDGFSDAAMECVLHPKYSVIGADDRKNLFIMIGSDWGQTMATIAELEDLLKHSDDMISDRIFFVINHNMRGIFEDSNYNDRKQKIIDAIEELQLTQKEKNNIFFLKMSTGDKYHELGIKGGGLQKVNENEIGDVFPKAVIKAVARYQEDFKDIVSDEFGERELLKLILGEEDEENGKA